MEEQEPPQPPVQLPVQLLLQPPEQPEQPEQLPPHVEEQLPIQEAEQLPEQLEQPCEQPLEHVQEHVPPQSSCVFVQPPNRSAALWALEATCASTRGPVAMLASTIWTRFLTSLIDIAITLP